MKESTARIGDTHSLTHDRTGSECFPSRWPEINNGKESVIETCIYLSHVTYSIVAKIGNRGCNF